MGIDIRRFRGSQVDEDLTCSICADVLESPLMAPCEHAFCQVCIMQWLDMGNNSCPLDRQELHAVDLLPPSRLLMNFLGKLEISCDFAGMGCQVFTKLDQLANHVKDCPFDPTRLCGLPCCLVTRNVVKHWHFMRCRITTVEESWEFKWSHRVRQVWIWKYLKILDEEKNTEKQESKTHVAYSCDG